MPLVFVKTVQGVQTYVNPMHVSAVFRDVLDEKRVHLRHADGRLLEVVEPPFDELVRQIDDGLVVEMVDLTRLTGQTPAAEPAAPASAEAAECEDGDVVEGSCGSG